MKNCLQLGSSNANNQYLNIGDIVKFSTNLENHIGLILNFAEYKMKSNDIMIHYTLLVNNSIEILTSRDNLFKI